jgi:hypothetical protein
MEKNKKNYYKKNNKQNYYKKNNKKEEKKVEKKVTYDSLMKADTISEVKTNNVEYNKSTIMKCIAITVVLFAIIVASLILFSHMK